MKITPFIAAFGAAIILAVPTAAIAQSMTDTHERIWHPSGKSPAYTYKMRGKPTCTAQARMHQSGKHPMMPAPRCETLAAKTPDAAAPATAQ